MTALSREMLLALGRDLGHPDVTIGSIPLAGREAWEAAVARATPPERQRMLEALAEPLLGATPHARARLD